MEYPEFQKQLVAMLDANGIEYVTSDELFTETTFSQTITIQKDNNEIRILVWVQSGKNSLKVKFDGFIFEPTLEALSLVIPLLAKSFNKFFIGLELMGSLEPVGNDQFKVKNDFGFDCGFMEFNVDESLNFYFASEKRVERFDSAQGLSDVVDMLKYHTNKSTRQSIEMHSRFVEMLKSLYGSQLVEARNKGNQLADAIFTAVSLKGEVIAIIKIIAYRDSKIKFMIDHDEFDNFLAFLNELDNKISIK